MTPSRFSNFLLLVGTLLLQANCYDLEKTIRQQLQCHNSSAISDKYQFSCSINSTVLVIFNSDSNFNHPNIQFNCYGTAPLGMSLPLNMSFKSEADTVTFNSCQFSPEDNILKIFKISLQLSNLMEIVFDNELIDSSLTRAHLMPLVGFVTRLRFKIKNFSTLPIDLFQDLNTLISLSIYSNTINSTHLIKILAPLENLEVLLLETNNLQEISENIFADKKNIKRLALHNITTLLPGFLSHLSSLVEIRLDVNYFESLPKDLFQKTKNLTDFYLTENRVTLKYLPEGLFRDMQLLQRVKIIRCGLESIDSDVFKGSAALGVISLEENNLHNLPLGLFADQKMLYWLDLSNNMLKTLPEGLFDFNKKLQFLEISHNQLTNLSINIFKHLAELDSLYLGNNNLLTISSDSNNPQLGSIFDHLKYLENLGLNNNSITAIPYGIIEEIRSLKVLDLRFNKINSLDCNFLPYFYSKILTSGNPIHCDHNVICLRQYIIQKPSTEKKFFGKLSQIRCASPIDFKDQLLYDLRLIDLLFFPDIAQANFSKRCSYKIRVSDSVLVMNCSDVNLNDIPTLPIIEQSFSKGIELYMDKNPLTELSNKILKDNPNVTIVKIFDSPVNYLPKGFLSGMTKLKTVSIDLPLNEIPEDIFFNSNAIETLSISGTHIESLPQFIFANLSNVSDLDISRNKLKTINLYQFQSNTNLQTIRLSHNFLEGFHWLRLEKLAMLKTLFLDNNRLKYVKITMNLSRLEYLNMENNKLTDISLYALSSIQTLLLRNNSYVNVNLLIQEFELAYVDLSLNNISSIDLSNPYSFHLDKSVWNFTENDIETIKITDGNFQLLKCNCKINFIVIDNKLKSMINLYESVRCLPPYNLIDRRVSYIPPEELLCSLPIYSTCPAKCQCWIRPTKSTLIVNCSNASLTEVPSMPKLRKSFKDGIELSIEYNELRSLKPTSRSGLKGVIKIFAAHNKITNISSEDIPENLVVLDVSYNKLEVLHNEVIQMINESRTLTSVKLYQNPFKCDCSSEFLTRFILIRKDIFQNFVQCADGQKLSELIYYEICSNEESNLKIWIGAILFIILVALLVLTILYFKNKDRILIWMYSHNICLRCVTEEELDRDKQFDAFISYSSFDMDFVGINLIPKLESGPKPYKLCLHDRDWLAGGFIPYQIEQSVECSRRTVIVMSQNYIKSQWSRMEFRTAHNASMNEKRPRVIVIMLDDNVQLEQLDYDLQKYIKMYTYIRWNDPWFWDKLSYALPHPSKKNQKIEKYQMSVIQNGNAEAEVRTG